MRTLVWIFGTLLSRSWLIVVGVLLGLLARQYFPPTTSLGDAHIVDPKAKAYYNRVVESNDVESTGIEWSQQERTPPETESQK